jgi:transcriptional regulator with XRE-family HTH domain
MVPNILKSIRLARIERNHTQEFIATRLNLTQSYYAKIERGNARLTLDLFFQLLDILELDYPDFLKQIKKKDIKCCQCGCHRE